MRHAVPPLILACVLLVSSAAAAAKRTALVSFDEVARDLEPAVRAALVQVKSIALRDQRATRDDVAAAAELGAVCEATNLDCLIKLAVLMNVDLLIVSAGQSGADADSLALVAVDAALGREVARETAGIPRGAERAAPIRELVQLLLEPQLPFGSLVVTSEQPGASLAVDGALRPESPHPRVALRLREGKHHIEVAHPTHAPFTAEVEVQAGAEVIVAAPLVPHAAASPTESDASPTPRPPAPMVEPPSAAELPPLAMGAVITSVAGLATAVIAGAIAGGIEAGLHSGLGTFEEKQAYQSAGIAALIAACTGGAVALGGGVVAWIALGEESAGP